MACDSHFRTTLFSHLQPIQEIDMLPFRAPLKKNAAISSTNARRCAVRSSSKDGEKDKTNEETTNEKTTKEKTAHLEAGFFTGRWVDSIEDLEAMIPAWDRLADSAIWKNATLEQNYLIPAIRHLGDGNVKVLVVEHEAADRSRPPLLCGLAPLVGKKVYGMPIKTLEIWKHDQAFDCTPLIHRDCARQTLQAIFDFLIEDRVGLLSFDTVSAEPEFKSIFNQVVLENQCSLFERSSFERAAFRPSKDSDQYYAAHTSKNARKKCRRLEKRLAEIGELTYEVSDGSSDYECLAEQFLAVEASGWKKENGTALACQQSTADFYRELIQRSAAAGKARFLTLRIEGRPVAMLSDIQTGETVFSYKTAFDEDFAAFSPGVQIELKNIECMHDRDVAFADSCTAPDNATLNRLWGQKVQFESVVVGLNTMSARLATTLMPSIQASAKCVKQIKAGRSDTAR